MISTIPVLVANTTPVSRSTGIVLHPLLKCDWEFDCENTKIIDYISNYRKRLTSKMIYIKFNKFSINKKEDIFTLNRIYFPLLSRINS